MSGPHAPGSSAQPTAASAANAGQLIGQPYQSQSLGNGPTSPNSSNNNIAKINARLRARNPVVNSMQAGSPQMLLPLSQRGLSPASQQVLPNHQGQQQQHSFNGNINRPNSYTLNLNVAGMNKPGSNGLPPSRDLHNQRKMLHKSLNQVSANQPTARGRNDDQSSERIGSKPLSSHGINMSMQMLQQRRQQSLDFQQKAMNTLNPDTHQNNSLDSGEPGQVHLKSKIAVNSRRRNAREKSYDLYNQKIQLPPMNKLTNDQNSGFSTNRASAGKTDRTYSLPSGGAPIQQSLPSSPHNYGGQNQGNLPSSPNGSRFPGSQINKPQVSNLQTGPSNNKGFFSARIQQNQNLRDLEPPGADSMMSPRRQIGVPSNSQDKPLSNLRTTRQKSQGRHNGALVGMSQPSNKPLSPLADNTPRSAPAEDQPQQHSPQQQQVQQPRQNSSSYSSGDNQSATTRPTQQDSDAGISDNDDLKDDPNIQFVEVQQLLFGDNPPVLNPKTLFLKNHEPTKASLKKCGVIKSYAANTNQGIIREYNEDRVSIILNILKPKNKAKLDIEWPQICFFGVFDGHGGAACADYLRDNLHNFVVQHEQFPQNPMEAIKGGFFECERNFIQLVEMAQARAQHQMPGQNVAPERSGSCASVVLIINDTAYTVNVGDSRCIMSIDAGCQTAVLTRDHKPDDEQERLRIQAAGGKIYRTQTFAKAAQSPDEKDLYVQGPLRVFPGRLSVSRTFGDIEAKRPRYGGNPNVVICEPEITVFKLKDNFDFFMIGCDGIFERLNNKQIIESIWERIAEQTTTRKPDMLTPQTAGPKNKQGVRSPRGAREFHYDEHIAAAEGVEIGLRTVAASRSLDNITILILGLKNLKTTIKKLNEGQTLQQVRAQMQSEQREVQHTYDKDFFEVEVNESDLTPVAEALKNK